MRKAGIPEMYLVIDHAWDKVQTMGINDLCTVWHLWLITTHKHQLDQAIIDVDATIKYHSLINDNGILNIVASFHMAKVRKRKEEVN